MHPRTRLSVVTTAVLLFGTASAPAIKHQPPREASGHPEVVLITAKSGKGGRTGYCCGVLLGPTIVLSAAHGVTGYERWEVVAPYAKGGAAHVAGKAVRAHPDYRPGQSEHDLAVLLLDQTIAIDSDFPTLPGEKLLPLDTPLLVVGRTLKGKPSDRQLFEAATTLVAIRGENNLYGGNPQVAEPGDSGGPIYLARRHGTLAALVEGALEASRANVPTDIYIPLGGKNRAWILRQLAGIKAATK